MQKYRPTILGKMVKNKYGDYVETSDVDMKLWKIRRDNDNHNHQLETALCQVAKALSDLPPKAKNRFALKMFGASHETHKVIIQRKSEK